MIHKPNCKIYDITTFRTSIDSHLHWKDRFYKNSLYFRIYADFDVDNEIDISNISNKTTKI